MAGIRIEPSNGVRKYGHYSGGQRAGDDCVSITKDTRSSGDPPGGEQPREAQNENAQDDEETRRPPGVAIGREGPCWRWHDDPPLLPFGGAVIPVIVSTL